MRNPIMALLAAVCGLAVAEPLPAQRSDEGSFDVAMGAGVGWVRVSCDFCQTARDPGPSGYVRVDRALRRSWRLGGEVNLWTHRVEGVRENFGTLMAVLTLHPRDDGAYLKGGLGYLGYHAGDDLDLNTVGLQLGAGYDVPLRGLLLHGFANLASSAYGRIATDDAAVADGVSTTLLQLGVGITLR
jgi:hypothetical protein